LGNYLRIQLYENNLDRNKEANMDVKISNWLLLQDEKHLSMIKDKDKRAKHLEQLYSQRTRFLFLLTFVVLLFIAGAIMGVRDSPLIIVIILLYGQIIGYLDTDSKIKAIRAEY
jgi:hypothetical protein